MIDRRRMLQCAAGVAAAFRRSRAADARNAPSFVVILTDDQHGDMLQSMPHLQRLLAGEGVTFPNAIVPTPLCAPSRSVLLSGQYAHETGVVSNKGRRGGWKAWRKGGERDSLFTRLSAAGYFTAMIGKYMNGYPSGRKPPPGVDFGAVTDTIGADGYLSGDWGITISGKERGARGYLTDQLDGLAVKAIRSAPENRPLFLVLGHKAPHLPYDPEHSTRRDFRGVHTPRTPSFNPASMAGKPPWMQRLRPLSARTVHELDRDWRDSLRLLVSVDAGIPRIIDALEETGRLSNTWIFFLSDNGYFFGQHRLRSKGALYEDAVNCPLVVRGPGLAPGTVEARVVSSIDIAATIHQLAGLNDRGLSGQPLFGAAPRSAAFMEAFKDNDPKRPPAEGLRGPDWSWIETSGFEEYYDLAADPWQVNNLAASITPERRAALQQRLQALRRCRGRDCAALETEPFPA